MNFLINNFARIWVLVFITSIVLSSQLFASDVKITEYDARAQRTTDWTSGGKSQQLNFKYANAKAILRQSGDIIIEGNVTHKGLRCATYSGGIRFGKGNPGCVDVTWITDPIYLTSQKQCNNAILPHSGADMDSSAAKHFDEITCGQFLLKCEGNCK